MADVFISYSRSDKEFVSRLADDLEGRGKDVWIDVDGIRDAEVFPEALRRAIEGADAFLFVISPHSVTSRYCELEVAHAAALHKRIVPVALRPVADEQLPEPIRVRSWIPADSNSTDRILAALDTDLEWERRHTRLTLRAVEWDAAEREPSLLLRGADLAGAEGWLRDSATRDPGPTMLEQSYVLAGRQAAARRQRSVSAASLAVAVIAIALLVFALIFRGQAVTAETTADAGRLAALSETQLPVNPERAVLLAIAAVRKDATYGPSGTMFALRAALDESTIQYRLPRAGDEGCGAFYPVFDPAPGSNLVVEGLCDGKVRFLDSRTGRLERAITLGSSNEPVYLNGFSFVGGRATLVGAVGPTTRPRLVALDPTTGAVIHRGPVIPGLELLTPDNANEPLLAAFAQSSPGNPGVFVVWNYRTGRTISIHPPLPTEYHNTFAFPGHGMLAISFQGDPGGLGLAVYDYVHRRVLATRTGATDGVWTVDSRTLAVALTRADGTGTVELLNARTLKSEPGFRPPIFSQGPVNWMASSVDGRLLAYGFQDGSAGVLDTSTGTLVNTYASTGDDLTAVAISPNDRLLITASPDGTAVAERIGGRALRTFPQVGVAFQNGFLQLSATAGGFAAIASPGPRPGEGIVVERFTDAGQAAASPLVLSHQTQWLDASLSPDGTLATAAPGPLSAQSAPMSEWSVPGRRVVRTITFPNGPDADAAISPTDGLLLTGTGPAQFLSPNPKPLVLIDLRSGRPRTLQTSVSGQSATCQWPAFAFSRTGATVAAANACNSVVAWDTATGRRLGAVLQVPGTLNSLAFSPDGRSLAVASSTGTVYVARVPLTPALRQIHTSTQSVPGVAFSPDGRYLATAGLDRTARIYDAHSLTELRVIQLPQPGQGVAFTTNSSGLLTWDQTGTVTLWDACTDCENPSALVALARTRVTRSLTTAERKEFGLG